MLSKNTDVLQTISARRGQIAVLIDPEKTVAGFDFESFIKKAEFAQVDYLFIGGSTVTKAQFDHTMERITALTSIPVVIFPGSSLQLSASADALLYLSLISGRNPDYLIGHHVQSAREVSELDIEVIPTGYILIDGDSRSSVAYVSQTTPIPRDKISIAVNTALAGILQGKKLIYLDAGSGARKAIPEQLVSGIAELGVPVITGGGIRSIEGIRAHAKAGANVIVIGNHIEENLDFLLEIQAYQKLKV